MTLTKKGENKEKYQPEAVGIYPKSAISWYNKGLNLYELGKNEEALVAYNNAIEINPKDGAAWDMIANNSIESADIKKLFIDMKTFSCTFKHPEYFSPETQECFDLPLLLPRALKEA
ncbi:MAG: tetratricopeptide repeat protein [Candidatus Methanoperedens sp.]